MHKRRIIVIALISAVLIGVAGAYLLDTHYFQPKSSPSVSQGTPPPPPPKTYPEQILEKMTLKEKVASLFILHTPGTDPSTLKGYITTYQLGGLIFMGDNIPATTADLQTLTSSLIIDPKLPPLLAVDEEGDTVKRLAADTFPGALTLPDKPPSATKDAFSQRSDLLKSVGLNLNFGIIADVTANPRSFIFPRVLGTTPEAASERVAQAVEGSKGKTLSTIKHFPGHGETGADSHSSIPTTATAYTDWQGRVALPFKAGIDAGADLVMFGHLRYSAIDSQPASLSKKWHDIIRSELEFKGLIITDDMIMLQNSGEATYGDPVANAVSAFKSGNDLLLYVLNHEGGSTVIDPNLLIDGVVAAITSGQLDEAAITESVKAVLDVRYTLGSRL